MKMIIVGLVALSSLSAFAAEELITNCSYSKYQNSYQLEKDIGALVDENSKKGFASLVAHSVSNSYIPSVGQAVTICVTSKTK